MVEDVKVVDPGTGGTAPPWFQGADQEVVGHIQSHGWDKIELKDAALSAVKSHRELFKKMGTGAENLLKVPKDLTDKEGWNAIWTRLGRPAQPKEYDLSGVKFANGDALNEKAVEKLQSTLFNANVLKGDAVAVVKSMVEMMDDGDKASLGDTEAKLAVERDALRKNWGNNYDVNLLVAKRTALAIGATPEAVAAAEQMLGYNKVMELFRSIGERIGEDKFLGPVGERKGPMTVEQAVARKRELMSDKAFGAKVLAGDSESLRKITDLDQIISDMVPVGGNTLAEVRVPYR